MKKIVSYLLCMILCIGMYGTAHAGHDPWPHDHSDYARMCDYAYTDISHTVKYRCEYAGTALQYYCGFEWEVKAKHTYKLTEITEKSGVRYAHIKCTGCPSEKELPLNNENWMATLPDDMSIGQVNLPGSASCASKYTYYRYAYDKYKIGSFNQNLTLTEQMECGSRIMHVDTSIVEKKGFTSSNLQYDAPFDNVLYPLYKQEKGAWFNISMTMWDIREYLEKHPMEFVVFLIGIINRSDVSSTINAVRKQYAYDRTIDPEDPWDIFLYYNAGDPIPTVGEVRGKCVMLFMNDNSFDKYAVYNSPTFNAEYVGDTFQRVGMAIQPEYNYAFPNPSQNMNARGTFHDSGYRLATKPGQGDVRLIATNPEPMDYPSTHEELDNENKGTVKNAKFKYGQRIGWLLLNRVDAEMCRNVFSSNLQYDNLTPETFEWPETVPQIDHELPSEDWMSYMPDNAQLSQINIPGTHDSGTTYMLGPIMQKTAVCQDERIAIQMENGIRLLDIRAGLSIGRNWQAMKINHGGYMCYLFDDCDDLLLLGDVMTMIRRFLVVHPTETILVCLSEECDKDDKPTVRGLIAQMQRDINENKDGFYPDCVFVHRNDPVPLLGDVRGKCVIFWEREETGNDSPGRVYTAYERDWDYYWKDRLLNDQYAMLDQYNPYLQDYTKRSDVFNEENARNLSAPGNPMIRFVGYNSNSMEMAARGDFERAFGPKGAFNEMKSGLEALQPSVGRRVGWIGMDFPTKTMIYNIIDSNILLTTAVRATINLTDQIYNAMPEKNTAQLIRWTDPEKTEYEIVAKLNKEAFTKNKDGRYSLMFRVYDEQDFDGKCNYDVIFPGYVFDVVDRKNTPKNTTAIKNAVIHTCELNFGDLSPVVPPKTGDDSNLFLWIAMLSFSVGGMFVLMSHRRKGLRDIKR